jgi:poly(hydroxyalkanoate) depolymerase family esterase
VIARLLALVLVVAALAPAQAAGKLTSGRYQGRAYALLIPSMPAADAPLVVALHGCWQTPEDFALGTRLNVAAEARGLVVLYPAQGRRDNPYRCWNWFTPADQAARGGEAAAILAMARHLQDERGMRSRRLIVIGFSAGGFMAVNLACAAPQVVSGIGVMAGGAYRCGVGPSGAMQCMRGAAGDPGVSADQCLAAAGVRALSLRASVWQGGADAVVNVANLSALETMLARALGTVGAVTDTVDGAVHSVHRDSRGTPRLESWLVRSMGHAWSGGDPRGTHTYPEGPPATERMLDFLLGGGR